MGLDGLKFSGSPIIIGVLRIININSLKIIEGASKSFIEKYGLNMILSMFLFTPRGFEDPLLCSVAMWIIIIPLKINGNTK